MDRSEVRADDEQLLRLRAQNVELLKEIALLRASSNGTPAEVTSPRDLELLHALGTALTHAAPSDLGAPGSGHTANTRSTSRPVAAPSHPCPWHTPSRRPAVPHPRPDHRSVVSVPVTHQDAVVWHAPRYLCQRLEARSPCRTLGPVSPHWCQRRVSAPRVSAACQRIEAVSPCDTPGALPQPPGQGQVLAESQLAGRLSARPPWAPHQRPPRGARPRPARRPAAARSLASAAT